MYYNKIGLTGHFSIIAIFVLVILQIDVAHIHTYFTLN